MFRRRIIFFYLIFCVGLSACEGEGAEYYPQYCDKYRLQINGGTYTEDVMASLSICKFKEEKLSEARELIKAHLKDNPEDLLADFSFHISSLFFDDINPGNSELASELVDVFSEQDMASDRMYLLKGISLIFEGNMYSEPSIEYLNRNVDEENPIKQYIIYRYMAKCQKTSKANNRELFAGFPRESIERTLESIGLDFNLLKCQE